MKTELEMSGATKVGASANSWRRFIEQLAVKPGSAPLYANILSGYPRAHRGVPMILIRRYACGACLLDASEMAAINDYGARKTQASCHRQIIEQKKCAGKKLAGSGRSISGWIAPLTFEAVMASTNWMSCIS